MLIKKKNKKHITTTKGKKRCKLKSFLKKNFYFGYIKSDLTVFIKVKSL